MAELNARIIAKASGTAGEVPQAADLEVAEVAVNTADGKFFTKHTDGTVKEISGSGGGGGGAVDSVNGQTGDVSLGVQDMNDFELQPVGADLQWEFRSSAASDGPSYYEVHQSSDYIYVNNISSTGDDQSSKLDLLDNVTVIFTIGSTSLTANTGPLDERNGIIRAFAVDQDVSALRAEDQSLPLTITYAPWAVGEVPLANGDILQWVDADQKFKPAQLPSGGGAVDSVNGETGVVSLGMQDMDDYALNPAPSDREWTYVDGTFGAPPTAQAGMTSQTGYSSTLFFNNESILDSIEG